MIAAVNVMNAAYMVASGAIVAGLQAGGVGVGTIFAILGVLSIATVAYVARAWGSDVIRSFGRMIFGFFFHLEVKGLENLEGAGDRVIIAPNHVSLLDGPLLHTVLPKGGIVRGQLADRHGVVGEAVPQGHQRVSAGANAAARSAHARQRGQRRRGDRDLPGRAHHRHRLHHEGVRRRRHDRRQGGCADRAGAHRRPGALALQLSQAVADQEGAVSEVHGDVPAAAPAGARPGAQGQAAAPGGRSRAAGHHGGGRRRHHTHRPHAVRGLGRRAQDPGHRQACGRRSAGDRTQLPQADPGGAGAWPQARALSLPQAERWA